MAVRFAPLDDDPTRVAGPIHRDLKPANILLAEDGPRVIDCGIVHAADATTITSTHVPIGTAAFMAPEQIRGRSATPPRTCSRSVTSPSSPPPDAPPWARATRDALIYRALNEPPELDDCPPALRAAVKQCLARDPKKQPAVSELMAYARKQTAGEALAVAGSRLPEAEATS